MAESLNYELKKLETHADPRGWLVEMLKRDEVDQDINQIHVVVIAPGATRGNHYHQSRVEWFLAVGGEVEVHLEDIKTKEKKIIKFVAGNAQRLTINPGVAHKFVNAGEKEAYLIAVQNDIFDPQNPDTFAYQVDV